jgi:hypothetical protein
VAGDLYNVQFSRDRVTGENRMVSFLDNLESNLKALESREEGGLDQDRRRDRDRDRSLAIAPWAERLKSGPYVPALMRQATVAGHQRRMKVNLIWIGTTLRLEARGHRLELRPVPDGIAAVFLLSGEEIRKEKIDLASDPQGLIGEWMTALDEQKRVDDAVAASVPAIEEE